MEFGSSHYSHRVRLKLVSAQPKRNLLAELSLSSARWTRIWGVPELERRSSIEWSRRMTRSLGVCYPRRGTVRLAAYLQKAERPFVEEVLCHEMAHLAARELYGDRIRPHGREWKRLMEAAGYVPRTRLAVPAGLRQMPKRKRRRSFMLYFHRCQVCQLIRGTRGPIVRGGCRACGHGVLTLIRRL